MSTLYVAKVAGIFLLVVGAVLIVRIVRGVYYEGWQPAKTPEKLHSQGEFVEGVSAKLVPVRH
jgi:hypothetical protein